MDTTIALVITYIAIIIFIIMLKKYFKELKNKRNEELIKGISLAFLVNDAEENIEAFLRCLENNDFEIISKFEKIVFINENSKDDTFRIIEKMKGNNEYIEIREILTKK